jgi:hypothetical protein
LRFIQAIRVQRFEISRDDDRSHRAFEGDLGVLPQADSCASVEGLH